MEARRFELHREVDETGVSGTGIVAEGVEFRDGRCALRWLTATSSVTFFDSVEHVWAIHGHGGKTKIKWLDAVPGGRARGMPDTAFDPKELARGLVVELEHTSDFNVAKDIAKDHLVEDPAYYDKLAKIDPDVPLDNPCACSRIVEEPPLQENLANLGAREEVEEAKTATVQICNDSYCKTGEFLIRGDAVEFVSVEQVKKVGVHKLDPAAMPSDIRLPRGFVVAHDATGRLLSRCDIYVVRWRASGTKMTRNGVINMEPEALRAFRDYYGNNAVPRAGKIEVPRGRFKRVALVRFIRYSRQGFARPFEHEFSSPQYLSRSENAWRVPLPEGCVIDSRGFVRP